MLHDDTNDYPNKMKERLKKLDARLAAANTRLQGEAREAYLQRAVPVFTQVITEAFATAGLVKSKAMTTLVQEIILTLPAPTVETVAAIIQDFGDFSREAGLGPEPLKAKI